MLISVVLPTIRGREAMFEQVKDTYTSQSYNPHHLEVLIERDHPTVGCAWQAGGERANGEFIHLGNDDCVPHPGWHAAAIEAVEAGFIPSPLVYAPDGFPQALPEWGVVAPDWTPVHCAMIPFLSREQWDAVKPLALIHYSSDNFITDRARMAGYGCVLRTGYTFTHLWAQPGRGAGMAEGDRMVYDDGLYKRALAMVAAGEWDKPWPPGGQA